MLIVSVFSVGFSGAAAAAGPSVSSVDIPDPSLTGTETAEVHISGTVDTGYRYNHYLVLYEKNPNSLFEGETKVTSKEFTPSDSSFDETLEFNVPNDENGEDHEYQVKLVQQDTISIVGGNTSVRSDTYIDYVSAPDSEDPDPEMISTDERFAPDSYISYGGDADPRDTTTYDINDPPTIHPGETVTINYHVRNEGGKAGEYSAIQMQFPSLDQQSDEDKFSIFSGGFRSNQIKIAPGDTVYDQDGSESDATSWQFERALDFVQSGSEYGFSADVTPEEPGEFTVLVRATYTDDTAQSGSENQFSTGGSVGDPDQDGYVMKEITFEVEPRNEAPTADAGGPYEVKEGGSVDLDASGSSDSDGSISSESWTVTSGKGDVSGGTYYAPDSITSDKSATVELTVEDDDGATDTDTAKISISDNNQPPNPEANGDYTVEEGGSITLNSAGTSDSDGTVTSKSWAVTSGPGSISGSTYNAPGAITEDKTATVELTATDDDGDTATDEAKVTISDNNQPPTADAGGPYSVNEGGSVTLDSSGSTDSDGSIVSTSWTVTNGDGSISDGTYSAPDSITSESSATVKVTVTDDDGATDSDTARVTISDNNQPPNPDANGDYMVNEGESIPLNSAGTNDPDGTVDTRSWKLTNGPGSVSGSTYEAPDDITEDKTATVQLTVSDNDGATASDDATITIVDDNQAPTADAGGPYSVSEARSVELDSSGSSDPDGTIQSRSWTVISGQGSVNNGIYQAPTEISSDTEVTVQLTVTDDDGASTTDTAVVSVTPGNAAPTANNVSLSTTEDSAVSGTFDASDPDGDSLSYSIESQPAAGTVSVTGESFTYTPESISSGTDSFTYRVDDGNGGTDTATVLLDISPSGPGPSIEVSGDSARPGGTTTITLGAENAQRAQLSNIPSDWALIERTTAGAEFGNNVGGDSSYTEWQWSSEQSSSNVSVTFELPASAETASHTLDATAGDAAGNVAEDTATVTVTDQNQRPTANLSVNSSVVSVNQSVSFVAAGAFDPDGEIVEYRWNIDGDGNLDEVTTTETITHAYTDTGTYEVGLTVVDDDGATNSTTTTVTVESTDQPTGDITGTVLSDTAEPIAGATVTLSEVTDDGRVNLRTTTTDSAGSYVFSDLEPGVEYQVNATYRGKTGSATPVVMEASTTINVDVLIRDPGVPNVEVVEGSPATDTIGDGKLNDINGDETFDIFDVQALYNNLDSDAVQNNPDLFDFSGNGESPSIFDVQALYNQLQA